MLVLLVSVPCAGVVIDVGDGSGNVTAPEDDPGFVNVGMRGIASAVYLGNRWVMTASHLGAGTVTFDDTAYSHVPGEFERLSNPAGLTEKTDILLFRIQDDPGLPSLRLPCGPVPIGSEFTLIGRGHDRETEKSFWDVEIQSGENNDIWTPVETEEGSDRQGFQTLNSQTIRWGQGLATLTDFDTESGFGDVLSFQSSFDPNLGVESLSQGVRGDSGGAVFQKNGGLWELIGMIHAVSLLDNQPGGTRTVVYGNETFIADLFQYADQIRAIAASEPALGDLNSDGTVDDLDIDILLDVVRFPALASCHFDLVGEGNGVDGEDVSAIVELAGGLLGDSNLDGTVDFADFLTLSGKFGEEGTKWVDGDFDGDDQVSFADFLILSQHFGNSLPNPALGAGEPVPEPASRIAGLLGLLLLSQFIRRPRRRLLVV